MPEMHALDFPRHVLVKVGASALPVFKSRLWCRVFGRLIRGRKGMVASNLGIAQGLRWEVPIDRSDLAFGRPDGNLGERGALAVTAALADPASTFFDVGANWGLYTALAARHFKNVVAIEPEQALADALKRNIERNGISASVLQAAVSDHDGQAVFLRNLDDDAMGSLVPVYADRYRLEETSVPVRQLCHILEQHDARNAVLKIDVEGHGGAVWRGLRPALSRVSAFLLEITGPEAQEAVPKAVIQDSGWHGYYMADMELRHSVQGEFEYIAPFWNWLFIPLGPERLAERLRGTKLRVRF
jgi:FkbM family methyltransferase